VSGVGVLLRRQVCNPAVSVPSLVGWTSQ